MSSEHEPPSYPDPVRGTSVPGQHWPSAGGSEPAQSASPWGTAQPMPPPYGVPAQGVGAALADQTARNWAVGAHLSGFIAALIALGFLGPLTVLLVAGNTSPFVRRHAAEALNFNLSVLIYLAVSTVLLLVLVGFVLIPLIGLMYLVSTIRAAMAASRGEDYRYPLTLRFIR